MTWTMRCLLAALLLTALADAAAQPRSHDTRLLRDQEEALRKADHAQWDTILQKHLAARRAERMEAAPPPVTRGVTAVDEQDSLALVALYEATDGLNWADNTNWLTGPVYTWVGVTVFDRRVTRLSLSRNRLSGPLPTDLGTLTHLRGLFLINNQLTGTIPPELAGLDSLGALALSENQLTGEIPPELAGLTRLETIYLWENQLSGPIPPGLGALTTLRDLWLSDNQFTGTIPVELGNLTKLRSLDLGNNQLTGTIPPELGNLSALRGLCLLQQPQRRHPARTRHPHRPDTDRPPQQCAHRRDLA